MKITNDETAGGGAEHRADQTRYGDEAHGADEFGFWKCPDQSEPAHGHHHGSAAALQDAAGDEDIDAARNAAKERPQSKKAYRGCKDPARAEAVGHPAADWNKHCQTQSVTGQHRFHAERGDGQRFRYRGDGRVQNCGVEGFHEESHRNQPR